MAKNLLIVESPAKAKTINKYLGKDFNVLASYGHVRDLVPKEGAVDPERGFAMNYAVIEKNEKHVDAIAKAAAKADSLYLATDLDREGEAISWHISEILRERNLLDGKALHRVVFSEITPHAIQEAVPIRATCRSTWSMPSRRGVRSITWSASTCHRCCGARCSAACRPDACNRRRCA
jgi:DNA topoisomerase-1